MKFLIMVQGTQAGYDAQTGNADGKHWTPDDVAAMYAHMGAIIDDLAERGELVDAQGLVEPKQARLVTSKNGIPVVSDGPFSETKEVVAGYFVVDVENIDRAVEIAARAYEAPMPEWDNDNRLPLVVRQIAETTETADPAGA